MKRALLLTMLLLVAPLAMVRVSLVAQQPVAAVSLSSNRQESSDTATDAPTPVKNAQVAETSVLTAKRRVVEEARSAFLAHNAAYDEGTVILEMLLAWSNRWLAAELAVASTREEQLAAARKHLERMEKRRAKIKKLNEIGARGGEAIMMFTIDYYVADAERRLAEIEAAPDGSGLANRRQGAVAFPSEDERKQLLEAADRLPSSPDKDLRYDGKTFYEWAHELRTDLSLIRRKEAMLALGEFAGHGFGKRAAEMIFKVMQGYSTWMIDNSPEGQLKEAAINAAKRVPTAELMPVVSSALVSDNVNLRLFGLRVMPVDDAKDQVISLAAAAMKDSNPQVAMMARTHLALVDHDNPAVMASLRQALASGRLVEIENALWFVRGGRLHATGLEAMTIPPYLQLVSEAVALLNHQDKEIRAAAHDYLFAIGTPLLEPLREILSSGKASDAARRLYEEIEAFSVDRRR